MASFSYAGMYYTGRRGQKVTDRLTQLWALHWCNRSMTAVEGTRPMLTGLEVLLHGKELTPGTANMAYKKERKKERAHGTSGEATTVVLVDGYARPPSHHLSSADPRLQPEAGAALSASLSVTMATAEPCN